MCAHTTSPPMCASGVVSPATTSAMPTPKEAIRSGATGRPWMRQRPGPQRIGEQGDERRQQLERLEDAAPDVSERDDHGIRGYAGPPRG